MNELLKLLRKLMKQGFASAAEKATVATMVKELTDDEQKTVADDVETVTKLAEKPQEGEAEAAVKQILSTLGVQMDAQLEAKLLAVKADLDAQVKAFMEKHGTPDKKGVVKLDMEKFNEWAKSVKAGKATFSFDLPLAMMKSVPVDMSVEDSITGELPQAELDSAVSRDPQREPFIEELVNVGTISSNLDAWIETTGEEGEPLPVAELAAIPQKSYDFARRTAEVKKIGVHTKHSAEMAEDLPNLIGEIRTFLLGDLRRKVDEQILKGDGTDENLTGILENATAYAAGGFAGTVLDANHFDVIETAVAQVVTALHNPTHVIVHPTDRAKMRLSKGNDGHYVLPPFIMSDGSTVSGVRVVVNTGIDTGKFLVGDFRKSTVKYKRGLTVEMTNSDQDDFVKDRFTTKATVRLVHRVRENDYEAFVYGDFATAITALDLAS